ncbi:aminotransferase class I/II-fold pyridoxal phosphate-dependent enzyme [Candidatus Woesearchaeota archaeon]|nr:aminotransferase class I/II-fold pyridoxal phosphate-dependent enzyme [Candidatus Woesearchaeota archaeon]
MNQEFQEWSKKRGEIVTDDNFSSEKDFQRTIDSLNYPDKVVELNPALERLDVIADITAGKQKGFFYARTGHSNYAQLEERLKAIEVGRLSHPEYFDCKVFPSGMAAITAALEALAKGCEGTFVHGDVSYISTKDILADQGNGISKVGSLPGIKCDLTNPENLERVLEEQKAQGIDVLGVIFEPVANPTTAYSNVRKIADIAHKYEVPVIVDNTFLTPYQLEPFRMGADMVIHSLTKYFSGQGDMMGGAVIMPKEFSDRVQDIRKNKGSVMSPRDAYEFAVRAPRIRKVIEAHCKNAKQLADTLREIDGIEVSYSDLTGETRNGYAGGVLSFNFKGDAETAYQRSRKLAEYFIENPGTVKYAVSLAEPQTLVIPWASQLSLERIKDWNVPAGLVRIAVGREKDFGKVIDYIKKGIEESVE